MQFVLYLPACAEATGATRIGPRRSSGRTRGPSDQSLSEVDSGVLAGSSAPRRALHTDAMYCKFTCAVYCTALTRTGTGAKRPREQTGGLSRTGAEPRSDATRRALLNVPSRTLDVQLIGRRAARVVAESERCTALTSTTHTVHITLAQHRRDGRRPAGDRDAAGRRRQLSAVFTRLTSDRHLHETCARTCASAADRCVYPRTFRCNALDAFANPMQRVASCLLRCAYGHLSANLHIFVDPISVQYKSSALNINCRTVLVLAFCAARFPFITDSHSLEDRCD